MAGLQISNIDRLGSTAVPNLFIDRFMTDANGEFVKIYLLLLRQESGGMDVSISGLADGTNNTEKDVIRALRYWEKCGLFKLEYNDEGRPVSAAFVTDPDACHAEASEAAAIAAAKRQSQLEAVKEDEDFKQLIFVATKYTKKDITPADCDKLVNLYANVGMSAELLEYVVEYCVGIGKTRIRYIEQVALDWNSKGITTVEQAKQFVAAETDHGRKSGAVMKEFGLYGRAPAASEQMLIDKWFKDYGFPVEIVLEACDRTIRATHQPSFEYADKILSGWNENGVRSSQDIERLDAQASARKRDSKAKKETAPRAQNKQVNKFHNFKERDYDADELLKQINGD